MTYEVRLTKGAQTVNKTFGAQGGTVRLEAGTWNLAVKAYNNETPRRLRGSTDTVVQITPGKKEIVMIPSAVGVRTAADLRDVLTSVKYNDTVTLAQNANRNNLIVLEGDIDLGELGPGVITPTAGKQFTVTAEPGSNRAIYRGGAAQGGFAVTGGAILVFGRPGESGTLTLNGNGADNSGYPFLQAQSGGKLVLNGNSTITNCVWSGQQGGAVRVLSGGLMEINGGRISNNRNTHPSGTGGGVYAASGGTLDLNNGTVSGNSANSGGGIYADTGSVFNWNGGTVSGNTASAFPDTYPAPVTVTFDGNGNNSGTAPAAIQNLAGTAITLPGNTGNLGKAGFVFTGWNTQANGLGTSLAAGSAYTPAADITLYAVWATPVVTFDSQGGTAVSSITGAVSASPSTTRTNYHFLGWYTAASGGSKVSFSYTPAGDITLYAHWISDTISTATEWKAAIEAVNGSPGAYSFAITGSFGLDAGGSAGNPDPVNGVDLTLTGTNTITLTSGQQGSLLRIVSGVILTLNGPTLAGVGSNNAALVNVLTNGTFTLQSGTIQNNTNTALNGAGGGVSSMGTFTMSGGSIQSCSASQGGGVFIGGGGITAFSMTGGTIGGSGVGNTATSTILGGGGVYVNAGTFTMSGSTAYIQNNTAANGGGVHIAGSGKFDMQNGHISTNTSTSGGGGVYVNSSVTPAFTMSGGIIGGTSSADGNSSGTNGGGVLIASGAFQMSGNADIQYNTAASTDTNGCGGGVYYNSSGTFSMSNTSTIRYNTARSTGTGGKGGGVYIAAAGNLTMSDTATINGNQARTTDTGNGGGSGGGVYFSATYGTFTMEDSTVIEGNSANGTAFTYETADIGNGHGGGVYVYSGTFNMQDSARIGGLSLTNANTSTHNGGGLYIRGGSAAMSDNAVIQFNTAPSFGGGVYIYSSSTTSTTGTRFTVGMMTPGTCITNNTLTNYDGGGVYIGSGHLDITLPANVGSGGAIAVNSNGSLGDPLYPNVYRATTNSYINGAQSTTGW